MSIFHDLNIRVIVNTGITVTPPTTPTPLQDASISSSQFLRKQCQDLRQHLLDTAHSLPPEPMVRGLMPWLQENFSDLIKTSSCDSAEIRPESTEETWTALLHLNHMRSKEKYIKLIEKCTSELCLTGRLFKGKQILILLDSIKKITDLKDIYLCVCVCVCVYMPVCVSLSMKNHDCPLFSFSEVGNPMCEIPQPEEQILMSTFEVKYPLSLENLKRKFDLFGLTELSKQYLSSLI
uniref:Uncharacterized protein n=1 Tax=Cyprinus carpio TaxID=7962 RepID=A0A8C2A1W2_CYPCA